MFHITGTRVVVVNPFTNTTFVNDEEERREMEEAVARRREENRRVIFERKQRLCTKRKRERFELDQAQVGEFVRAKERKASKEEKNKLSQEHVQQHKELTERYKFLLGLEALHANIR